MDGKTLYQLISDVIFVIRHQILALVGSNYEAAQKI